MRKRLLKVISLPVVVFILMVPMIIIQSIRWVITGKKSPMEVITDYMEWLNEPHLF